MRERRLARAMSIHQLHPRGLPMSWQDRLDEASTEADVVAVVREFLATVSPSEVARLPVELRPRKIVDASDVTQYAFDLVRGDVLDNEGTQRVLHRLAHVSSRASLRLSAILTRDHPVERAAPDRRDENRSA
jgi:hypothetical protein